MRHDPPTACAIIVAGGTGTRAQGADAASSLPKQYQLLAGKPVIIWSIEAFASAQGIAHIIVVCAPPFRDLIASLAGQTPVLFADAGPSRTASVRAGLAMAATFAPDFVLIHDAARPGLTPRTIAELMTALTQGADGAAPALALADALWESQGDALTQARDRAQLVRVQTPQAFPFEKILAAYQALPAETELADDIAVARQAGLHVVTVVGDARLDKITWAEDFARMDALLSPQYLPRTATGYDAHRFGAGDHVTLCGVAIHFSQGLAGHSDADVGWHALADAIYGGLAAGDIGHHFPPSDSRWKGAPSATFLSHAAQLVAQAGGRINHVDVTLICEAPRIGPHRPQMVAETAKVLGLRPDQVSIKATTTEGMGFTGRGEGIAAQASATLLLPPTYRGQSEDRCP